jgi:hypothetical protein
MYSRSAKGGEKGDPNCNPWLAKMGEAIRVTFDRILRNFWLRMRALFQGNHFGAIFDDVFSGEKAPLGWILRNFRLIRTLFQGNSFGVT